MFSDSVIKITLEDVLDKVQTKEHKGNYGNSTGKSPNSLYKKYKTWAEDNKKTPMGFPQWMTWAQEKGLVKGNYSADAVNNSTHDIKQDNIPPVKSNMKKYVSVVMVGIIILVLYSAFKSEDKK